MGVSDNKKKPILVITGATASGKTSAAISAAKTLGGEIVSADSMQIYRHLDIGTAKPSLEEQSEVRHHLIDIREPDEKYSVFDYVNDARAIIDDIHARGCVPIICGGTGLYIDSLINGIKMQADTGDDALRAKLESEYDEDKGALYGKLANIDPHYASKLHINDKKRIVRAMEKYLITKKTTSELNELSREEESRYVVRMAVLGCLQRSALYLRIEQRVDEMLTKGIVKEASFVYENRYSFVTAAQAIGYKEFFPLFQGEKTLEECTDRLKQSTRNYAKRQISWFGRYSNALTVDVDLVNRAIIDDEICGLWN